MKALIKLTNINKEYPGKVLFKDFNFSVHEKEKIVIMGPSGSGKSTLLNIVGLLDTVDSGETIHFGQKNININSRAAMLLLRDKISYLFQNYALIDSDTVYENLVIALKYSKSKNKKEEIKSALKIVGVEGFDNRKVYTLSGGEQQRVALARLIIKPSELILADEPTGNLDDKNADEVVKILTHLGDLGKSVIMVTHNTRFKDSFDRTVYLENK